MFNQNYLTRGRHPKQVGQRHGGLREPPGPGEVPRPDFLVDVGLEGVDEAAVARPVEPREEEVPVAAGEGGQGQDGEAAQDQGSLEKEKERLNLEERTVKLFCLNIKVNGLITDKESSAPTCVKYCLAILHSVELLTMTTPNATHPVTQAAPM